MASRHRHSSLNAGHGCERLPVFDKAVHRRHKPDRGSVIHLEDSFKCRGVEITRVRCAYGGAHVFWTADPEKVTCPACLANMRLDLYVSQNPELAALFEQRKRILGEYYKPRFVIPIPLLNQLVAVEREVQAWLDKFELLAAANLLQTGS